MLSPDAPFEGVSRSQMGSGAHRNGSNGNEPESERFTTCPSVRTARLRSHPTNESGVAWGHSATGQRVTQRSQGSAACFPLFNSRPPLFKYPSTLPEKTPFLQNIKGYPTTYPKDSNVQAEGQSRSNVIAHLSMVSSHVLKIISTRSQHVTFTSTACVFVLSNPCHFRSS